MEFETLKSLVTEGLFPLLKNQLNDSATGSNGSYFYRLPLEIGEDKYVITGVWYQDTNAGNNTSSISWMLTKK